MADSQSNENTCVVCFKNVLYYSIGECDHPVCFECSTRMRVLCLQNECPICRQDLARVVFTTTVQPYKELRNKVFTDRLFDRQFKIGYCSEEIKQAYDQLLENRCKLCEKIPPFRHFSMLSDHMRKVHERHFCDLCVKHLRIFTSERKCYTRQELAHHRRKGDLDDTSHRGHPLCEFCEERFMDADELYRHLRKEHLYCHLCDADGKNLYYASHAALAHHFRTDHYLCEEGECAGQHLTAVFRSDIDLKAHKATVHGRGMPRGAARQARTLELQFNITPHPVIQRTPRERERERERERADSPEAPPPIAAAIDTRSDAQFPRLSAAQPAHNLMLAPTHKGYKGGAGLARTDKNFPALDGSGSRPPPSGPPPTTVAATILRNSKPSMSIQLQNQGASARSFRLTQTGANARISHAPRRPPPDPEDYPEQFPELGARDDHPSIGAAATQPPKVALINSQEMQSLKGGGASSQQKKPQMSAEAFPALSGGGAPAAPPQWITVPRAKDKRTLRAPPPPAPRPSFPPQADFPTLPANTKAKKNVPAPAPTTPRQPLQQPNDNCKPSKKEKKKQNSKKENQATIETWNGSANTKNLRDLYMNADININNESVEVDKKIKTVESAPAAVSERSRNGGTGDFALAAQDYPPLSGSKRAPVGVAPPPGFQARPTSNGMTFTNSAGQTFSAPVHTYIPPPDFESRNRQLVRQFAEALGGAAVVEQFKVASRAFRDGCIGAAEFHGYCRVALGDALDEVFPELVALLPDIPKQQELALASGAALGVCSTCGQLLALRDVAAHDRAHWPDLSSR